MPALASDLRRQLENVVVQARDVAEAAARSSLQKRAVDAAEPFAHFGPEERENRNRLRARGRQVGDVRRTDATQGIEQLTEELAYEYWHRMLFARFLAENHLLMHPTGEAVSLEECDELALIEGAPNGFVLAARYASKMLPQIFRTDDVLLEIEFAPEHRLALERLLTALPRETFLADDSLGWVYQFWQTKKKDEVNKSGEKIDGRTLPAVTQLFTEHYMVQFLLHNSIGAWWCGRHNIKGPAGGAGIPGGPAPVEMEYLRWKDDGTPAAGTFDGWPKTLAEFTLLDPCCGSGHFLVAAFNLLVPLRMHDEMLTVEEACDAVLRDNLHGLELDPRCTQIAAFALALAAWKYPSIYGGPLGYRELPRLNLATSGQGVSGKKEQWLALANGDSKLQQQIERLYEMFLDAPHLGSLIDPVLRGGPLFKNIYAELHPRLARRLAKFIGDAELSAVGVAAQGIAKAAEFLARRYTLVATNVPYLGRGKQAEVMKRYLQNHYKYGKADLATAFVIRCLELCVKGGSTALVTPQNWLFLGTYKKLRELLLKKQTWNIVARLGPNAFRDMNWWAATTALIGITASEPGDPWQMSCIDVSSDKQQDVKAARLANREPTPMQVMWQADQLKNPDALITFQTPTHHTLLSTIATSYRGHCNGDGVRFERCFWELLPTPEWSRLQCAPDQTGDYRGRHYVLYWQDGDGELIRQAELMKSVLHNVHKRGSTAWGRRGVTVMQMNELPVTLYSGDIFDGSCAVIVPHLPDHLLAIWAFVSSNAYRVAVRSINQKSNVENGFLTKVPFDLAQWQAVAAEQYPNGLPEPQSDDPTQWLFKGDIATSTAPLQVALARLLAYRWPDQPARPDVVDPLASTTGIVCLPGVRGEPPASEPLLDVLRAAYGHVWSNDVLAKLLTDAGCKAGISLHDWLASSIFGQHCKLFHTRPFVWHIWDGRKDGFSCLVNYHKLNHKTLENLTYAYLGDWITAQNADARAGKTGADLRLAAAQALQEKLKLILAGEPPYDIFVRWKPLSEQAIGWNPDLNDGVRMNIRPFVEAGVLRKPPNIKWTKDRGNEPKRDKSEFPWFWDGDTPNGDRVNNVHLTNAEKQAARAAKKGASS